MISPSCGKPILVNIGHPFRQCVKPWSFVRGVCQVLTLRLFDPSHELITPRTSIIRHQTRTVAFQLREGKAAPSKSRRFPPLTRRVLRYHFEISGCPPT
jgi:hypothetical protein